MDEKEFYANKFKYFANGIFCVDAGGIKMKM